jgi:hypothetical protein
MVMKQTEKIIKWILKIPDRVWWYAYDFMDNDMGDYFVGYEASARITDVLNEFPFAFEVGKDGKYRTIRFKFECLNEIMGRSNILDQYLLDEGITKSIPKKQIDWFDMDLDRLEILSSKKK